MLPSIDKGNRNFNIISISSSFVIISTPSIQYNIECFLKGTQNTTGNIYKNFHSVLINGLVPRQIYNIKMKIDDEIIEEHVIRTKEKEEIWPQFNIKFEERISSLQDVKLSKHFKEISLKKVNLILMGPKNTGKTSFLNLLGQIFNQDKINISPSLQLREYKFDTKNLPISIWDSYQINESPEFSISDHIKSIFEGEIQYSAIGGTWIRKKYDQKETPLSWKMHSVILFLPKELGTKDEFIPKSDYVKKVIETARILKLPLTIILTKMDESIKMVSLNELINNQEIENLLSRYYQGYPNIKKIHPMPLDYSPNENENSDQKIKESIAVNILQEAILSGINYLENWKILKVNIISNNKTQNSILLEYQTHDELLSNLRKNNFKTYENYNFWIVDPTEKSLNREEEEYLYVHQICEKKDGIYHIYFKQNILKDKILSFNGKINIWNWISFTEFNPFNPELIYPYASQSNTQLSKIRSFIKLDKNFFFLTQTGRLITNENCSLFNAIFTIPNTLYCLKTNQSLAADSKLSLGLFVKELKSFRINLIAAAYNNTSGKYDLQLIDSISLEKITNKIVDIRNRTDQISQYLFLNKQLKMILPINEDTDEIHTTIQKIDPNGETDIYMCIRDK